MKVRVSALLGCETSTRGNRLGYEGRGDQEGVEPGSLFLELDHILFNISRARNKAGPERMEMMRACMAVFVWGCVYVCACVLACVRVQCLCCLSPPPSPPAAWRGCDFYRNPNRARLAVRRVSFLSPNEANYKNNFLLPQPHFYLFFSQKKKIIEEFFLCSQLV